MLWTIYMIWLVLTVVLAIVAQKTEQEIYGFFLIISTLVMFYIPFMI